MTKTTINDLVQNIHKASVQQSAKHRVTTLIAIDGRGGSGKTTLASLLQRRLTNTTVVHLDDFAPESGNKQRLLEQVIVPLNENRPAKYQRFDWQEKRLAEWHDVEPGGIVIVEGVSTLHDALCQHFDLTIWIECPAEVGFERGLRRDRLLHGVDSKDDWVNIWMPEEQAYVEAQRPQDRADYVIDAQDIPNAATAP